jgi:hypothetical protein
MPLLAHSQELKGFVFFHALTVTLFEVSQLPAVRTHIGIGYWPPERSLPIVGKGGIPFM